MIVRRSLLMAGMFALVLSGPVPARAQDYPAHPVKIIVPIGPSSSYDILGRLVADQLSKRLNQSFVVENRPGGGAVGYAAWPGPGVLCCFHHRRHAGEEGIGRCSPRLEQHRATQVASAGEKVRLLLNRPAGVVSLVTLFGVVHRFEDPFAPYAERLAEFVPLPERVMLARDAPRRM